MVWFYNADLAEKYLFIAIELLLNRIADETRTGIGIVDPEY